MSYRRVECESRAQADALVHLLDRLGLPGLIQTTGRGREVVYAEVPAHIWNSLVDWVGL